MYSGDYTLRPLVQPASYGLNLNVGDIYVENISVVSLMAGLKIEGIVKWRGLNRRDHR